MISVKDFFCWLDMWEVTKAVYMSEALWSTDTFWLRHILIILSPENVQYGDLAQIAG